MSVQLRLLNLDHNLFDIDYRNSRYFIRNLISSIRCVHPENVTDCIHSSWYYTSVFFRSMFSGKPNFFMRSGVSLCTDRPLDGTVDVSGI